MYNKDYNNDRIDNFDNWISICISFFNIHNINSFSYNIFIMDLDMV